MTSWPSVRDHGLLEAIWAVPSVADYWRARFDEVQRRDVDVWDYQWADSMWSQWGLQVTANTNLIQYLGCLDGTAHTPDVNAPFREVPTEPVRFPLVPPTGMERDLTADLIEHYRVFRNLDDHEAEERRRRW